MVRYSDPWKKKSAKGMKHLSKMMNVAEKAGKAALKTTNTKKQQQNDAANELFFKNPKAGCLSTLFMGTSFSLLIIPGVSIWVSVILFAISFLILLHVGLSKEE